MSHQHHRPDFGGARVAVLLTGQAFRAVKRFGGDVAGFCVNASFGAQEAASRSVLSQVIAPLEASGAKVDVLFTFPRCEDAVSGSALLRALRAWFGARVAAHRVVESRNVGHSWQLAYMLLGDHMRRQRASYDFVLSLRHDLELLQKLTAWPANLARMLFFDRGGVRLDCSAPAADGCRRAQASPCCRPKVHDRMLWVPQRHLRLALRMLAHDDQPADADFNPHYLVERFLRIPAAVRDSEYHEHVLTNGSCTSDGLYRPVPPYLRAVFEPGVGVLSFCGARFYRFAPDRDAPRGHGTTRKAQGPRPRRARLL